MSEKEIEILSPFGPVHIPKPSIPKITELKMDKRQGQAMAYAVAIDISSIVGIIPIVGDIVSDIVEDTYGKELNELLTPAELKKFNAEDRVAPATIALARTFMEVG